MTINLAECQIGETIHTGLKTVIYRVIGEVEPKSAIVKTLRSEFPTLEEITRLRHEYKLLQHLDIEGVVKAYALENYQNGVALILEDFGTTSLKNFITSQKLDLTTFLKIAIKLAKTLGELHKNNIIHKDIKPHNILIDADRGEVKVIDFSIATQISRETQAISNPSFLEGTIAYMSPEQTGRMNRTIDYRTDLYSLGVTFYEILTGQLPFTATDPMELIHSHIALMPVAPKKHNPEIPGAIEAIAMKLLAKNAEDRYQSSYGLQADLEECLAQWQGTGFIEDFTPGLRDKSGQFLIPQKLYGREAEVAEIFQAFDRVASGTSEMMLVSGYSGIGKTSVVNEVHKPILRDRGYFIAGKFDQFKRNIPYAALIQAFSELVRQLLTESEALLQQWKELILEAVGDNGQLIIDVIPEVERIIGKQQAVPEMGPTETQNRFNRVFKQFLSVFTKKEHPLVIFLDDLQWADSASLKLIELLISDTDSQYLLLLGAYRDNEVSATHPLVLALEEIQKAGAIANNIVLKPLELADVRQLVADTFNETEKSQVLADLLFHKTGGNPFFLTQLLQTLHSERLLQFDFSLGRWQWDIKEIQAIGIADYSVVELLARNILKLSEETQEVLKLAACIGNQFYLDVLATVNKKSLLNTASDLWYALQAGLILPTSNAYKIPLFIDFQQPGRMNSDDFRVGYKFLHDRVQQAAYSLIPETEKKATHLKIGQLLLQKTAKNVLEENVFDIVNQLNVGLELIDLQSERDELASLNLTAGKRAKAATAYEAAVMYLRTALKLLPENSWDSYYEFTLSLHVEAAEAEYLNTNFELAEKLTEVVLERAKNLLEKVKVYELKIQFCIAQNKMLEAIEMGVEVVELLGFPLSQPPNDGNAIIQLPRFEYLESFPVMKDAYQLAAMRILMNISAAAVIGNPSAFMPIILTMVNLCIRCGHSALAAFAYVDYGMILSGAMAELDAGYYAGQLALRLLEQFNAKEIKSKVYAPFNGLIRHWKEPLRKTLAPLQEGIQSGLETGDYEYASLCAIHYCSHIFWLGEPLESVLQKQKAYIDLTEKLHQIFCNSYIKIYCKLTIFFHYLPSEKEGVLGSFFDEYASGMEFNLPQNNPFIFWIFLFKATVFYYFKNASQAVECAAIAAKHPAIAMGQINIVIHNFFYSLALLANYGNVCGAEQENYLSQVEENQIKMKHWAENAPANYQHKYELVEAEKAFVLGRNWEAAELYDQAINGAKENGYIQEEALANERAGEFYLFCKKEKIAKIYMTEAYYGYIRWGAVAKVKDLDERYPNLISRTPKLENTDTQTTQTTTTTTGSDSRLLDITTVVKASQTISSEIVLSSLLDKLMKIVIENAGATRGCLLTKPDFQWVISAFGTAEANDVTVWQPAATEGAKNFPLTVIKYIERTQTNLILDDAISDKNFARDPYIAANRPQSILCFPILYQGKLTGILYLENNQTKAAFISERVEVLKLLTAQASISIENARIYAREQEKSRELEESLHKLQQTQAQLVQTEKISSLGQLVAGVAHEVNNPVSFINGNLHHAYHNVQDLLDLVQLYQQEYPTPSLNIQDKIEEIELDYLIKDLPQILTSMQVGTDRIKEIMQSLRNYARIDGDAPKLADIHAGINSTLMILQHRLKASGDRPSIQIVKEYGDLPSVECYFGQLNQVFMNFIANAIDAFEEYNSKRTKAEIERHPSAITIRTEIVSTKPGTRYSQLSDESDFVAIRIADNGPGMPEDVQQRLFEPFFTTKPVGKGTGLGLSISYSIVVEKHRGNLKCVSTPGLGTEFIIEIPTRQIVGEMVK